MKLPLYHHFRFGFIALLILGGVTLLTAQSPDRPRGNAIIFSAPKSDTVSSNLNELRAPASPFREMESSLKKPFELFGPNKPGQAAYPTMRTMPPIPPPELKRKSQKEILNQRAEEMFLDPGQHPGETDDDLFKTGEDAADPYGRKPKTSLDRYYDRMDRAMTNRTPAADSQVNSRDSLDPLSLNKANPFDTDGALENRRNPGDKRALLSPNANDAKRNSFFGDRSFGNQTDSGMYNKPDSYYPTFREQKVDRLDAFKQLLEGPSPSRPNNALQSGYSSYGSTAPRPAAAPALSGFDLKPASGTTPANTFAKSAGLVGTPGKPQDVPDYAVSSTSLSASQTPQPAKPVAVPTFSVPKRRF